ncbi:MAG TPA: sigma-70 family RNA polymerase sigma factor [Thermoanaerobaculia bacterium]|nr:sigma-70 family RNA polymerase sigma factor [Thermoanaerobaculia bacterium]
MNIQALAFPIRIPMMTPREQSPVSSRSLPLDSFEDERRLLADYSRGDRAAAERLVAGTYRQVFAFLAKLCGGDADLAADLTQDTYKKAWDALPRFDGRSRFATWLCRIAYTTLLNHIRRPRRVVQIEDEVADRVADPEPSPEDLAGLAVSGERLRHAVMALPEPLRETITAHFWGGTDIPDIARDEGVTAVAIRKRIKKALAVLAHSLDATLGSTTETTEEDAR